MAPRLDGARSLLLLDIESDEVSSRQSVEIQSRTSADTLRFMKEHGVEVIICGGITNDEQEQIRLKEITVIPWVTGDADRAIDVYLKGRLEPGSILCPGRKMGRWHFCERRERKRF